MHDARRDPTLSGLAPAKINLFLHVGAVQPDCYHPLASLVAFADVGDVVTVAPAERLSLSVVGPFAGALSSSGPGGTDDNLILKALRALGQAAGIGDPPVGVLLDKRLPIAAGLGGGSSDAGTALRLTRDMLGLAIDDAALEAISAVVGADGPMCLRARSAWAEGIGEVLHEEPSLPPLPSLLLNDGSSSPTGPVYRAYDAGAPASADRPVAPLAWTPSGVIDWLGRQRNDLEAPAVALCPAIGRTLAFAATLPGVRLARMSGSGATVFALFDDLEAVNYAARIAVAKQGDWWIRPVMLGAFEAAPKL